MNPTTTPISLKQETEMIVAAYWFAHHQLPQQKVAEKMGVSPSKVSRLLALAEDRKLIRRTLEFVGELTPEAMAQLSNADVSPKLLTKLQDLQLASIERGKASSVTHPIREVTLRVAEVLEFQTTEEMRRTLSGEGRSLEYVVAFGKACARRLSQRLSRMDVCALTWGSVLFSFCDNLALDVGRSSPQFIPIIPNLGQSDGHFSSSSISGMMNRRYNSHNYSRNIESMTVNAFVPHHYYKQNLDEFVEYVLSGPGAYTEILGGFRRAPGTVGKNISTLITGLGRTHHPYGRNIVDFVVAATGKKTPSEEDTNAVKRLFLGDFGGTPLVERGVPPDGRPLNAAEKDQSEEFADLWTGLKVPDLQEIARCATTELIIHPEEEGDKSRKTPADNSDDGPVRYGVIALGQGPERSRVLIEAVKLGIVSEIYCDGRLYDQLMEDADTALSELGHVSSAR